jgi:flagellum-specific peptidoglycan hydrolase FlgJ
MRFLKPSTHPKTYSMTPEQFVAQYYHDAVKCEAATGIPRAAILTQAALESGWGNKAPGNNFFGIKDTDGVNGNETLVTTFEYLDTNLKKFPVLYEIKRVVIKGLVKYRYKVGDYFRAYATPADSFIDHGNFLVKNKRYHDAFKHAVGLPAASPTYFLSAVCDAGYATAPDYKKVILSVLNRVIITIGVLKAKGTVID